MRPSHARIAVAVLGFALAGIGIGFRVGVPPRAAIEASGDTLAAGRKPVSPVPPIAVRGARETPMALPQPAESHADPAADRLDERGLPGDDGGPAGDDADARVASILSRLQQFLDQEPRDAVWAGATERSIERGMLERYPRRQSRLTAVHCKASLCRLELAHRSSDDAAVFVRDFGLMEAFRDVQAFYAAIPGTSDRRTLVYVSRTGGHLPPLN